MITTQAFPFFQGRGVVDETVYPYLSGGLLNPFEGLKARRNERELRTSRIFLKGLVWLLAGRVRWAYLADGKLFAEVQGSSGAYTAVALADGVRTMFDTERRLDPIGPDAQTSGDPTARLSLYVPNVSVNYYGSVLLAVNAARLGAPDFLAALKPLVTLIGSEGLVGSEREKRALALAADELYFAAAYGPTGPADLAQNRLNDLTLLDAEDLPTPTGTRTYVDLTVFNPAMRIPTEPTLVAASTASDTAASAESFRAVRSLDVFGPAAVAAASKAADDKQASPTKAAKDVQPVSTTAIGLPVLGSGPMGSQPTLQTDNVWTPSGRPWHKVGAHQVAVLAVKSQQADMAERQFGSVLLYVTLKETRAGIAPEVTACDIAERFMDSLDADQAERILEALEPRVKDCQGAVEAIRLTPDTFLVWVRWVGRHVFDDMVYDRINARIALGDW